MNNVSSIDDLWLDEDSFKGFSEDESLALNYEPVTEEPPPLLLNTDSIFEPGGNNIVVVSQARESQARNNAEAATELPYAPYVAAGLSVFPLRNGSKDPATANGFRDATRDPQKLASLFPEGHTQIGVVPGSGGLLVIDLDIKDGATGELDLEFLEERHAPLPETLVTLSPSGGRHYWFRKTRDVEIGNAKLGGFHALDVRSDRGYVCVHPTETPKGSYYFDNASGEFEPDEIADAPEWLMDLLVKGNRSGEATDVSISDELEVRPLAADESELLAVAFGSKVGEKIRKLWDGDWEGLYPSQSDADAALLRYLAFYFHEPLSLEMVFSNSELGKRDKWTNRTDYRRRQIGFALSNQSERYQPPLAGTIDESGWSDGIDEIPPAFDSQGRLRYEPRAYDLEGLPPSLLGLAKHFESQTDTPEVFPPIAYLHAAISYSDVLCGRRLRTEYAGKRHYCCKPNIALFETQAGKSPVMQLLRNKLDAYELFGMVDIGADEMNSASLFMNLGITKVTKNKRETIRAKREAKAQAWSELQGGIIIHDEAESFAQGMLGGFSTTTGSTANAGASTYCRLFDPAGEISVSRVEQYGLMVSPLAPFTWDLPASPFAASHR